MTMKRFTVVLMLFFALVTVGFSTETKGLYVVVVRTAPYAGPRVSLAHNQDGWRVVLSDFGIYFVQLRGNVGKYVLVGRREVMEVQLPTACAGDVVLVRRIDRGESQKNRLFTLRAGRWK